MASEQALTLKTERMQAKVEDGIGWMILNNPARHNALSLEMWEGVGNILEHFAQHPEVRVVVMRGAGGKAFVSGADISEFDKARGNAEQRASYGVIAGDEVDRVRALVDECFNSEDYKEGRRAFAAKRKPVSKTARAFTLS